MKERKESVFNQIEYQDKYNKEHYDRIEYVVKKGRKDEIKAAAWVNGQSLSEFILSAIEHYKRTLK